VSEPLFLRTTIAIIWDFDTTLIPGYMQEPLFRRFEIKSADFWKEVNALPQFYRTGGVKRAANDTLYLNHLLNYVRDGKLPGLTNKLLRQLGNELEFYPGLPEFFQKVKDLVSSNAKFATHQITLEHYIVSTGLREMIMGSKIAPYVDDVWACEFAEESASPGFLQKSLFAEAAKEPVICEIAYSLDHTSKTRAIFEINKGCNKEPQIEVNTNIAQELRRVPFRNMIYIADGPSDVPCFSTVGHFGGRTYAVYKAKSTREFEKAYGLQKQHRVEAFGEANYEDGSPTAMWISHAVQDIAERIVRDRNRMLGDELGKPPGHVTEPEKSPIVAEAVAAAPNFESTKSSVPRKSPSPTRIASSPESATESS